MSRFTKIFAASAVLALGTCQSVSRKGAVAMVDTHSRVQEQACSAARHSAAVYERWSGQDVRMELIPGTDEASACCQVLVGGKLGTQICLTEYTDTDGGIRYDYRRTVQAVKLRK